MPLLFSTYITYWAIMHETQIAQWSLVDWFWLSVVCVFTSVIALTPPTLLALVFGYFLGFASLPFLFMLNMLAILLVNIITQKLDKNAASQLLSENPKVENLLQRIKKEELRIIFFTKISPVLPFALTNLVFSLSGAKLKNILLGGFLGMIPRTIIAVWTGSQAKEIRKLLENPNEGTTQKIMILALLLVSIFGLFWVVGRALKK